MRAMRHSNSRLAAALALAGVAACATTRDSEDSTGWVVRTYERDFLDEPVRLTVWAEEDEVDAADEAADEAFRAVARVDQVAGDRSSIAEVRTLVAGGTWVSVSRELHRMIQRSVAIAEATDGAFDPTLGPLALLWRMAKKRGRLPDELDLNSARSRTGWQRVEVAGFSSRVRLSSENMLLQLHGVLHGASCDEALAQLTRRGFPRSRVDFGRVVVVGAAPPGERHWNVELPAHAGGGDLDLVKAGLSTAGPDEQWFELEGRSYSNEIDPTTGIGFTTRRTATVVARDGLEADGLAHALRSTADAERRESLAEKLGVRAWVSE
jgi:thiamine biosynthesis lipoprotein